MKGNVKRIRNKILLSILTLLYIVAGSYSSSAVEKGDLYRVGPDDILTIDVINEPELKTTTSVASDGSITFPYIGTVTVEGMTLSAIEEMIKNKLSEGFIKYPVVSVNLTRSMSRTVYAYGEVGRQGIVPYEEDMTILKVISRAGGVTKDGEYGLVKVRRKGNNPPGFSDILVDLKATVEGKAPSEMVLQPGDIVIVEKNKTFFIYGEVARTGQFILEHNMSVVRALSIAGGITPNGQHGKVKVRRKQTEPPGYYDVEIDLNGTIEGKVKGDFLLEPEDILIVERNKTYFVYGEVNRTGEFMLEKGITVSRAIAIAGGLPVDGQYGRVKVRRKQAEPPGYRDIEIDLNGTIEGSVKGDFLLEPEDILIVERNKTYFVYGEIMRPGEYTLREDMTAFQAITLAGGFTKWGSPGRVKILRYNAEKNDYVSIPVDLSAVIKGEYDKDIKLMPNDTIIASSGVL